MTNTVQIKAAVRYFEGFLIYLL